MKILILGCGNMGSAMLRGWLADGVAPSVVTVIDTNPSAFVSGLAQQGLQLNPETPERPDIALIAVKPQIIRAAAPVLLKFASLGTLFVSVAAGVTVATLEEILGTGAAIVRAMPNLPATIQKGISGIVCSPTVSAEQKQAAIMCLAAIGQVVQVPREEDLDAVTAVSGSGPAYVFHMIEALAEAGKSLGLPGTAASQLALATVEGAGALAASSQRSPKDLRISVTSPKGTTAAALGILMSDADGLVTLISKAAEAAHARSKELAEELTTRPT